MNILCVKENSWKPTGKALLTAHGKTTGTIAPALLSAQQPARAMRKFTRAKRDNK